MIFSKNSFIFFQNPIPLTFLKTTLWSTLLQHRMTTVFGKISHTNVSKNYVKFFSKKMNHQDEIERIGIERQIGKRLTATFPIKILVLISSSKLKITFLQSHSPEIVSAYLLTPQRPLPDRYLAQSILRFELQLNCTI